MTACIGDNRLTALAADIRTAHDGVLAAAQSAAERALAAGHALIEAKALLPHGGWLPWLNEHCQLADRTAQLYMRMARSGLKSATVADLGIRGAAKALSKQSDPSFDLDDTSGWPMPEAGKSVLINSPDGGWAEVWLADIPQPSSVRYFEILAHSAKSSPSGDVVFLKKPSRALGVAEILRIEGLKLADCRCTVFPLDERQQNTSLLAELRHLQIIDDGIESAIHFITLAGVKPTSELIVEFLTDRNLEHCMDEIKAACDLRIAQLQAIEAAQA